MDELRQKLDKFIEDLLKTTSRSTIVQVTAIYLLVSAFWGFCGGLVGLIGGGLLGVFGVAGLGTAGLESSGELAAASATLGLAAIALVVVGIISLITAPAALVVAIGLFQRKPWSRMGTVILATISAVVSLISLIFGAGFFEQIIWLLVGAFVAYVFYTDAGIKQELGG